MSARLIALGALLASLLAFGPCQAQEPTQPFYGVTSTTGAKGFQPVDVTHGLPVSQGAGAAITAGWPVTDGAGTDTTGTLTTSGSGSVTAQIDGYASAKIQVKGTYAAFTVQTQASSDGGTTTVPLQCAMVDGTQFGSSFVLAANASVEISCGHQSGDDTLILATAAGPATGTANITISPSSFPSIDGSTVATVPRQATSGIITGNATGTTSAVVGTLAASAGKTTYICGFNVSAIGGTAAVGPVTIAGLITSSMVYQVASSASGNTVGQTFIPCIPASAVNTAITITTTADGTASAVSVNSWGVVQ